MQRPGLVFQFPCLCSYVLGVRPTLRVVNPDSVGVKLRRPLMPSCALSYRNSFHFSSGSNGPGRGGAPRLAHAQPLLEQRKYLLQRIIQRQARCQFVEEK